MAIQVYTPPSLFGSSSNKPKFVFKPIAFDYSALAYTLTAGQRISLAASIEKDIPNKLPSARDPAIIAPWEINDEPGSLATRINAVRSLKNFVDVDPRLNDIKLALGDRTSQKLFAMYKALDALKTIAQYASEKNTLTSSLGRLDEQFQMGLQQLKDFMPSANLDKLSLFFGEKQSYVKAPIGLGSNSATFEGQIIQKGGADDPLAGIVGNEQFSIKLTNTANLTTATVNVNLANIVGNISVNSVVAEINAQIAAQAPTFQTTFQVTKDKNFDYGIGISGSSLESVQFIPIAADPALYVVSDFTGYQSGTTVGSLTEINSALAANPTYSSPTTIAGTDTDATAIATKIDQTTDTATGTGTTPTATDPVAASTTTGGVATDSMGFVYVLGQTSGDFDGQYNSSTGNDVFLNKYDSLGNLVTSRLVGSGGDASAYSIIVDANDNVIIAGQTDSHLLTTDAVSGLDSFVTKYDSLGKEVFTYQLDTAATDFAASLAVDAAGNVIVGGVTSGAISSTSGFGGVRDGMVLKLDGTSGALLSSQLIGGAGNEQIKAISIANDGNILIATEEDGVGFLRKLDATNYATEIFNVNLGTLGGDITDMQIDGTNVYIAGYTTNTNLNAGTATLTNTHDGGTDGFVMQLSDAGASAAATYTTYVGGTGTDKINDITISGGNIYVAGGTSGSIDGSTTHGLTDSFAASIDGTTGGINYIEQFGQTLGTSSATGIAFVSSGSSVLDKLGLPSGLVSPVETRDLITQTSLREGDMFYIQVNGGTKRRVTIDKGETIATLVTKINRISTTYIKAQEVTGDNGKTLKITAQRGGLIELSSGADGRDALAKMGIDAGILLSAELLTNIDPDPQTINEDDLGGTFGLNLSSGLGVTDKSMAKYAVTQLDNAISTLQRAYRSLVIDPIKLQLLQDAKNKKTQGTTPPYLASRIANFQDALNRLQGSTQVSGGGFTI